MAAVWRFLPIRSLSPLLLTFIGFGASSSSPEVSSRGTNNDDNTGGLNSTSGPERPSGLATRQIVITCLVSEKGGDSISAARGDLCRLIGAR